MPRTPVIQSRKLEVAIAIAFVLLGSFLLWDAFDNRGKDLPWYARWFSFW